MPNGIGDDPGIGTGDPTKKMESLLCLVGGESSDGPCTHLVAGGPCGSPHGRIGDFGGSLVEIGNLWNETKIEGKIPDGDGVLYAESLCESRGRDCVYVENRDSTNG